MGRWSTAWFWVALAVLGTVGSVERAQALRLVISTGKPVAVNLALGQPTAIIFPETIEAIPTSASKESLSLEVLGGNMLFAQLLEAEYETTMFVVTIDRQMHMLTLRPTPEGLLPDTRVQLLKPGGQGTVGAQQPAAPRRVPAAAPAPGDEEDSPLRRLLIGMMRGENVAGMRHVPMSQVLISRGNLQIVARHGFMLGSFLGMIAEASNSGDEVFHLRLPEFQAAGLRAIGAERESIGPGASVVVWLVVEVPGGGL